MLVLQGRNLLKNNGLSYVQTAQVSFYRGNFHGLRQKKSCVEKLASLPSRRPYSEEDVMAAAERTGQGTTDSASQSPPSSLAVSVSFSPLPHLLISYSCEIFCALDTPKHCSNRQKGMRVYIILASTLLNGPRLNGEAVWLILVHTQSIFCSVAVFMCKCTNNVDFKQRCIMSPFLVGFVGVVRVQSSASTPMRRVEHNR